MQTYTLRIRKQTKFVLYVLRVGIYGSTCTCLCLSLRADSLLKISAPFLKVVKKNPSKFSDCR